MALTVDGCITEKGREFRRDWEVAGGNCGITYIKGSQFPPPVEKWSEVVLPVGVIKILATAVTSIKSNGKKWINLEKDDLAKLRLTTPDKYLAGLIGPGISGAPCMVSAQTDYNRFKAFVTRSYRNMPEPKQDIWKIIAQFTDIILPNHSNPPEMMTDDEWLESMPADRRKPLGASFAMYRELGWDVKYSKFSVFIKNELLPMYSKDSFGLTSLVGMVDRLIYAPHNVTHCIAGPKIKPYMKWLKEQWHVNNVIFYAGTSPDLTQAWLTRATSNGPKLIFWSDYTMYEYSHNVQTWEFMESFYSQYKDDVDFQRVLNAWRAPGGRIGGLKFQARVMNASGRDDTAFANALLNGFAMLLAVTASWKCKTLQEVTIADIYSISSELLLSVCGDDALGFLPECTEERAFRFITDAKLILNEIGFKAKMFCSFRYSDAVYLGHRPYLIAGKWYWGKTLGRCLPKLGWQAACKKNPAAQFLGICKMHEVCSAHVPVLAEITRRWTSARKHAKVNPWIENPSKPWQQMGKFGPEGYDESTLVELAHAYTVDRRSCRSDLSAQDVVVFPQDFISLIDYCNATISGVPCVLDHWLLRHMVWVDDQ